MKRRAFDASDISDVLQVERACASHPWSEGQFESSLELGHHCQALLASNDRIVGFSIFSRVLDEACLLNIAVRPEYQGQGRGRRLLQQGLADMCEEGATRCYLEVRVSNTSAQALYRNFGFEQVGERKHYYPAETGREDALVLARALPLGDRASI